MARFAFAVVCLGRDGSLHVFESCHCVVADANANDLAAVDDGRWFFSGWSNRVAVARVALLFLCAGN